MNLDNCRVEEVVNWFPPIVRARWLLNNLAHGSYYDNNASLRGDVLAATVKQISYLQYRGGRMGTTGSGFSWEATNESGQWSQIDDVTKKSCPDEEFDINKLRTDEF